MRLRRHTSRRLRVAAAMSIGLALTLSACAGAAGGNGGAAGATTLTLVTVNNPQMKDMESLKGEFEKANPGITVKFIQMEENDLRAAVTKDVATGGGQYDIVTVGALETPIWAKNKWIQDLSGFTDSDKAYDVNDLYPPVRDGLTVDGKLYAAPFYGESSFLMYNKPMFAAAGITVPDHPTWNQVEEWAAKLKTADTAGICLRGKPGWGEMGGPLSGILYTSGSGWFDQNWTAQLNTPKFRSAVEQYLKVLTTSGEKDPASFGFTECLNLFSQGKAAMWYDATVAASTLESPGQSQVAGKVGYAHAPVIDSKESGWLWSWNLAIPTSSKKQDASWKFISWATGKGYLDLVGQKLGWERVPPGTRLSIYQNPDYLKAAAAFAPITQSILESINSKQFGALSQPTAGYFPASPEWPDLGNTITQDLADVLAGRQTLDAVLAKNQPIAQAAGDKSKG